MHGWGNRTSEMTRLTDFVIATLDTVVTLPVSIVDALTNNGSIFEPQKGGAIISATNALRRNPLNPHIFSRRS